MIESLTPRLSLADTLPVLKAHIAPTIVRIIFYAILFLGFWLIESTFKDTTVAFRFREIDGYLKAIPFWIYLSIASSFFYWWFGKGGRVSLPFPLIDFGAWGFLSLLTFASFAAPAFLPWWAGLPILYALNPFFYMEDLMEVAQNKQSIQGVDVLNDAM